MMFGVSIIKFDQRHFHHQNIHKGIHKFDMIVHVKSGSQILPMQINLLVPQNSVSLKYIFLPCLTSAYETVVGLVIE